MSPLFPDRLLLQRTTTYPFPLPLTVDHMEYPPDMTNSVAISVNVSSHIAHLRRLQSDPDVPEDIEDEIMLHFNDPNWDFRDSSSMLSISTDGVDSESRRSSKISGHTSAGTAVNTESHASSWHVNDPKADFSSNGQAQLRVLFLPCFVPFCSTMSSSPGIHLTPRSAQPSQIPTTQQCL